ncbi:hypothetical protein BsWGS_10366 [Bradybaena similaris]
MTVGVFQCPSLAPLENGNTVENKAPAHMLRHSCKFGYHLEGPSKQDCINGSWTPSEAPFCVLDSNEVTCISGPVVLNARVEYNNGDFTFPKLQGSVATVQCEHGYSSEDTFQTSYIVMCGLSGLWALPDGSIRLPSCTRKHCPAPPEIPNALVHYDTYNLLMSEGFHVEYICNSGYILLDPSNARLTCRNGQWEGPVPTCVLKANCEPPAYVRNGNWNLVVKNDRDITFEQHGDTQYPKFEVGTQIEYSCSPGYKLVGHRVFECLPSQIWSSTSPECIPESENIWYCPDIGQIKNGFCKCMGESTADLQLCMPYHRGTQIQCTCLQGYKLQGVDTLTCIHSSNPNIGVWDWESPRCYKDFDPGSDIDLLPDGQNGGKSFNSADINIDGKNKVSSLVIVVTTACSVLGVLLLIMVIVVFRRKKPRAHLFQQGPAPPPYARVHDNSLDEHDRMALMAYADASRVHLPSYEESIRSVSSQGSSTPPGGSAVGPSASPTSSEYRRLPNLPPAVRAANLQHSVGGDGNNNINSNNNSNRHSTVTTSTMNRDGVSEIFGSLDTVNVSMSDASTSVTVETFDSGVSNRSMASQRAAAGSLNSSDDQIASDDAPLLDSNSQREVDVASVSSNPSRSSKDDQ